MADDVKWGKVREDFLVHRRTAWFSAVEQSLFLQCRCANRAGVLERSIAHMARVASGDRGLITVTSEMIQQSIGRLVSGRHCVWYRELETLWWVNMADEQQPGSDDGRAEYWAQLGTQLVPKLGTQVREGLLRRYPQLDPKKTGDHEDVEPADTAELAQVGLFLPDTDTNTDSDTERERPQTRGSSLPSGRGRRDRVHASFIDAVIDEFNAHRSTLFPDARGVRKSSKNQRGWVRTATKRERATLDDWLLRIRNLTEAARRDPFWRSHVSLEHLHRAKNWEKWGDETSLPPEPGGRGGRGRGGATPAHAPSDFEGPDQSFGGVSEGRAP